MILSKRLLRRTDLTLIAAAAAIVIMSLVIIGSATHVNTPSEERYWFVQRQGISIIVDIALAAFLMNFDYKILQRYGNHFYVFNLILLILVMLVGQSALGAQRWIALGPISIQPSEFSKLIMIIALAAMMEKRGKIQSLSDLAPVAGYVLVPFLLVLKQPDLGTSLVFLAIFFGMVFVAGIRLRILFGIFGLGLAAMPVLWHFLKDYQKMRIMVFMDPNVDPLGAGYHIIQSKIAIGSGGLTGKGFLKGTQTKLNYVPEQETDFIFCTVGEEAGFLGSAALLLGYAIFILRIVALAERQVTKFGRVYGYCVASIFLFHLFINVGMVLGLVPVIGIPLPFFSYGGSSLWGFTFLLFIFLGIDARRKQLVR